MRPIEFRIWDNEEQKYFEPIYEAYKGNLIDLSISTNGRLLRRTLAMPAEDESMFEGIYEIEQFTGRTGKNNVKIFKGDRILFWVCYPTTQTHTGDNIPNGSYTEPDETQFLQLEAEVIWDEDSAKWGFSILSKPPYQFSHYFNFCWFDSDKLLPIIDRASYSLEYIKGSYGYEGMSDDEWKELLSDVGFTTEQEMMNEINEIEVIGNIHTKTTQP
jgi:hypothetical protein